MQGLAGHAALQINAGAVIADETHAQSQARLQHNPTQRVFVLPLLVDRMELCNGTMQWNKAVQSTVRA